MWKNDLNKTYFGKQFLVLPCNEHLQRVSKRHGNGTITNRTLKICVVHLINVCPRATDF